MSSIRILEDHVVNKIAAGEVVERPASVVRELVQNALDAGAKTIMVALGEGGRELVRVADDGSGMARDDALMCLERHATSKIAAVEDLDIVSTLGFRGEALPSIAAVGRLELRTRLHDADAGTSVQVHGGEVRRVSEIGCAPGTDVAVRNLFFNTPARRKFLRTASTELSHCVEAVVREALVHPGVDFSVRHQGRVLLRAPPADGAARVRAALRYTGALSSTSFEEGGYAVQAHFAPPRVHRATTAGSTYLFVGHRFVRDLVLRRALRAAYRDLVPAGRHPLIVLRLEVPPGLVDVNVHPAKAEVRFRDPTDVTRFVSTGLRAALLAELDTAPPPPRGSRGARPEPRHPTLPLERPGPAAHPDDAGLPAPPPAAPATAPASEPPSPPFEVAPAPVPRLRRAQVLGTAGGRLAVGTEGDDLLLVDLHAARLALAQARLAVAWSTGAGAAQRFLTPQRVELSRGHVAALVAAEEQLSALYLDVVGLDPGSVALRGLHPVLAEADAAELLTAVGSALVAGSGPDAVRAAIARHAVADRAVALDHHEVRTLLAALDEEAPDRVGGVQLRLGIADVRARLGR